ARALPQRPSARRPRGLPRSPAEPCGGTGARSRPRTAATPGGDPPAGSRDRPPRAAPAPDPRLAPVAVAPRRPGTPRPPSTSFAGSEPEVTDVVELLREHRLV